MRTSDPFTTRRVTFSLSDIGSEVIDQLASDIHTSPDAIIRELVKNAYDSYLELDPDLLEDREIERAVRLTTDEFKGERHLYVVDNGIGLSLEELKAFVQIAIRPKRQAREGLSCTGFRGLGTWASLGAGSSILVESQKLDTRVRCRLAINVRRIYQKMGPETTLDDILNDSSCVEFGSYESEIKEHGTTVEIICDGEPEKIQNYQINRLHPFAASDLSQLRELVVKSCPIPYAKIDSISEQIYDIYQAAHYTPTAIYVGSENLQRRLPAGNFEFKPQTLTLDDALVAITWRVFQPDKSAALTDNIDPVVHVLNGPSLQLCKYNVPIGPKASDNPQLNHYIGEVHIVHDDLLPNADGTGLRQDSLTVGFKRVLAEFYAELEKETRAKSKKVSAIRAFSRAQDALSKNPKTLTAGERVERDNSIKRAVELVDELASEKGRDRELEEARLKARRQLKQSGDYEQFSAKALRFKGNKSKKSKSVSNKNIPTTNAIVTARLDRNEYQKLAPLIIPKLENVGLDAKEIKAVLSIFEESLCT
jgi:histidine kinase/DNA gyrase B/HSP90-like ATPase